MRLPPIRSDQRATASPLSREVTRSDRNWNRAKALAVVFLLALAPYAWIPLATSKARTLLAIDYPLLAFLYVVSVLLGGVAIVASPYLRTWWLRWLLVVIVLLGSISDFLARVVQGAPLTTHMLATFIQARQEIGHAVGTYPAAIVQALLIFGALAVPLLRKPLTATAIGSWFLAVPATAFILSFLIMSSLVGRVEEFPAPIAFPIQLLLAQKELNVYLGPRDDLRYQAPLSRGVSKIVLIVDESVRGDYLQLNDARFDNTPYLVSALPMLANYGVASSYSNCSATDRMALRSGARETDIPDPQQRLLRQPTFWQYAKKAGYRTVYIDGWLRVRPMSSMLTYDELKYVDDRMAVNLEPYYEADSRIADLIVEELQRPEPAFIFVEKIGLHSPYTPHLPMNLQYKPAFAPPNLSDSRKLILQEYLAGIWWRVDRFFERLLPAFQHQDSLMVYTSDHGQALFEGGYDATHCSAQNAVKGEGLVPLFVTAGDRTRREAFQAAAARTFNRAAHSDIFPTIIAAMGFDPQRVDPPYAAGLLALPASRLRRFFVFSPFVVPVNTVAIDEAPGWLPPP